MHHRAEDERQLRAEGVPTGGNPLARHDGLVVRKIGNETIVYDVARHAAHCLNAPAALVFGLCDGRTSTREMGRRLSRAVPGAGSDGVPVALEQLGRARLLEGSPPPRAFAPGRRALLRRAGLGAALLLPAVITMGVPTPAEAAATCVADIDCPSNEGVACWIVDSGLDCDICSCSGGTCVCS